MTGFTLGFIACAVLVYIGLGALVARRLVGKIRSMVDVAAFAVTVLIWPLVKT